MTEKKFDISLYNDEFFAWHAEHVHVPMLKTGGLFMAYYKVESIVDFGCGIGSYLLAAHEYGVPTIRGFEIGGEYAKKYADPSLYDKIDFNTDVTEPQIAYLAKWAPKNSTFDYSFCIEVAEHIEPSGSEQLVKNITAATNRMAVFTAAPMEQDGCGHINTHSKIYWIELFENNGFKYDGDETVTLKELWEEAPDYVLKNLMVFKHA